MNLSPMSSLATVVSLIHAACAVETEAVPLRLFGDVSVYGHQSVAFSCDLYCSGEVLAVNLHTKVSGSGQDDQFMIYASLTVNVVGHPIPSDCFFAKCFGEATVFRDPLLTQGWFEDTGNRVPYGPAQVEVWRVTQKFCDAFIAAHQAPAQQPQAVETA